MNEQIPLVDLKAQYHQIQSEIDGAIARVLHSTNFILGSEVAAFEKAFAGYCGVKECVGVSSGTSALILSLRACGVGPGDEVITVAHTFIATAEAISAVGAKPVFVDVDPVSYTLDAAALASAINERTRAVIPVHLYGQPADMTRIMALAAQHRLVVIEDAAQAHGASWQGVPAGNLGDVACFSFYPGKNLGAYGDAGLVATNRTEIAERVRLLRNHGRRSKYLHDEIGFGERLDALQAAILGAKLPHLDAWTTARRRLARRYHELLAGLELHLPQETPGAASSWHLYVIRTAQRDALMAFLNQHGVGAGVHYPVPLHLQPAYAQLGYHEGDLPVTEEVARTCLSLPIYPEMTEAQQQRVAALITEFVERAA